MNLVKELDRWYKEWSGVSHIEESNQPIHDSAAAQDFAGYCINEYMAMRDERLAALEGDGWKWWVEWAYSRGIWYGCVIKFDGEASTVYLDIETPNKAEAEAACIEYLLNLNTIAK